MQVFSSPPVADRLPLIERIHGFDVADPYRWLEDDDDPRTRAWTSAQDRLYGEIRRTWAALDDVRRRLAALGDAGVAGTPVWAGGRRFQFRRAAGRDRGVLSVTEPDGSQRVLLDPAAIGSHATIDAWHPSPDGTMVACQVSERGTERSVLSVLDVRTGETIDGPIDRVRYSAIAWTGDSAGFYYVRRRPGREEPGLYSRVHHHSLGACDDPVVFGAHATPTDQHLISMAPGGRRLFVSVRPGAAPRNDLWFADIDLAAPADLRFNAIQRDVAARTVARQGPSACPLAGRVHLLTDREAPRRRICVVEDSGAWRDLIPEDPSAVITGFEILTPPGRPPVLLVARTRHAVGEISAHDLATGRRLATLPLPGTGSVGGLTTRPDGGADAWFSYTDFTTPATVLRYDTGAGLTTSEAPEPGRRDIETRLDTCVTPDGTTVRMFVVGRDLDAPGPRAVILAGYGGFGVSMAPAYSPTIRTWADMGGLYVLACVRGGSEEGQEWHRAAMRERRQNAFDDFMAVADHLVDTGMTTRDRLGITGGSNGGLLVGAVMTQRPDLCRAVVCASPVLDMARYERFGLGPMWTEEYGSAADPAQFANLISYSPYHRVVPGAPYPSVMFTVSEEDTRVAPCHARKMTAALQHAAPAARVVLRREPDAGHAPAAVSRAGDMAADVLAFFAHELHL